MNIVAVTGIPISPATRAEEMGGAESLQALQSGKEKGSRPLERAATRESRIRVIKGIEAAVKAMLSTDFSEVGIWVLGALSVLL